VAKLVQVSNGRAARDLIAAHIAHTLSTPIYIAEVRFATKIFFYCLRSMIQKGVLAGGVLAVFYASCVARTN
jgi:hypothetical protein